jgi:hypothetical protein
MQVALNGKQRYKLKVYGHEIIYFILSSTKETQMCYTEIGVITRLEFLIYTIFVEFGGHIFQQLLWCKKNNITFDMYLHIRDILLYKSF